MKTRRDFLRGCLAAGAATATGAFSLTSARAAEAKGFSISLAQWSYHKAIFGKKMDHLDFAQAAKDCGIDAIEYVNQFFKDKAQDSTYLAEMNKRAKDLGVQQLLIMIDGEGHLGDPDEKKRAKAVENHHKWIEAAKALGCHSIRVNAASDGKLSYEEQQKLAADGLARLTEFGEKHEINVIVENHGGLSSNGAWLAGAIKMVNNKRCGTLPDFGNFRINQNEQYDRYKGVAELMPYAKAVSAKSYDFNADGDETTIDYFKIVKIVLDAGYHGRLGIEYEGGRLPEKEGIIATRKLLERVREKLVG